MKTKLRIYAAGGCGIKLAHTQIKVPNKPGYAKPAIAVFDSSKSDLEEDISNHEISHVFLNEDGLGKNRSLAAKVIRPHIPSFIGNNPPGQVNLVIFGLAGGTGSVGGPMIMKELLQAGENVIALIVGNATNHREATNTLSTINDLNKMAAALGKAVPIMYFENRSEESNHHINVGNVSAVDALVGRSVHALSLLLSGEHIGIDSKDITNFLNYNNTTSLSPKMVEVCFTANFEDLEGYKDCVYSAAMVAENPDVTIPTLNHSYEVRGRYNKAVMEAAGDSVQSVLFITTPVTIPEVVKRLKSDIVVFKESATKMEALSTGLDEDEDDMMEDVGI